MIRGERVGKKWIGAAVGARTEDFCPDLVGDAVILEMRIASPSMPGSQLQPPELLPCLFELLQSWFKDRIQIIEANVQISRNLILGKVVIFQLLYAMRHTRVHKDHFPERKSTNPLRWSSGIVWIPGTPCTKLKSGLC